MDDPASDLLTWHALVVHWPLIVTSWIAIVGGCLGSFLNVVVYRLPRRLSLVHPSSHCPRCQHPIRLYDNVPVLAWCWLRGRCRACRAPISVRYPLVEGLFALLYAVVWYTHVTLPLRESAAPAVAALTAHGLDFLWRITWLSCILTVALIDIDRQPIPSSIGLFAAIVGLVLLFVGERHLAQSWEVVSGFGRAAGGCLLGSILGGLSVLGRGNLSRPHARRREGTAQRESPQASGVHGRSELLGRLGWGALAGFYIGPQDIGWILILAWVLVGWLPGRATRRWPTLVAALSTFVLVGR